MLESERILGGEVRGLTRVDVFSDLGNGGQCNIALWFSSAVVTLVVARVLQPVGLGYYSVVLAVAAIMTSLVGGGISRANLDAAKDYPELLPSLSGNSIALAVIWGGLVTAVLTIFFGDSTDRSSLAGSIRTGSLAIVPLLLWNFAGGLSMGTIDSRRYYRTVIVKNIIFVVLIITLARIDEASGASIVSLWIFLITIGALFTMLDFVWSERIAPSIDLNLLQGITRYGRRYFTTSLYSTVLHRIDLVFLALLMTPIEIGNYSIALLMVSIISMLPVFVAKMALRNTSKASSGLDIDSIAATLRIGFFISFAAVVFLIVFGRDILLLFLGSQFLPAYIPALALIPGAVMYGIARIPAGDLFNRGISVKQFYILLAIYGVLLLISWWTIPFLGMLGIAMVTTITQMIVGWLYLRSFLNRSYLDYSDIMFPRKGDISIVWNGVNGEY